VTTYRGIPIDAPTGVTSGPDRALWFTSNPGTEIGRITTAGVTSSFTGTGIHDEWGIVAGPDGALWFTNDNFNTGNFSIGRITAVPMVAVSPSAGPASASVPVSGEGYKSREQTDVSYRTGLSSPPTVAICSAAANPDGTFSCAGTIPAAGQAGADGAHEIKTEGAASLTVAKTTFALT
jgi:hypothetical protein